MSPLLSFLIGCAIGAITAFFVLHRNIRTQTTRADAAEQRCQIQAEQSEARIGEIRVAYERMLDERTLTREHLTTTFKEVAGDTLRESAKQYADSASKDFKIIQTEAAGEIQKGKTAIEVIVKELREQLQKANEKILAFETERGAIFSRIQADLQRLHQSEDSLRKETSHLRSALTTSSSVRGRWGEASLENLLQSIGMLPGTDYVTQESSKTEDGERLRPDFIISLPGSSRRLVIDAKTSLYDILTTPENELTEEQRVALHKGFAERLRARATELASKGYADVVSDAVPFIVMYVPSEAGIRAAFEADADLFHWASERKVMLTSPVTIIPLILLVAGMREEVRVSENATHLQELVEELGNRLKRFFGHLEKMRKGLQMATDGWNDAVQKSWLGRQGVPKTIEKVRSLGGAIQGPDEDFSLIVEPLDAPVHEAEVDGDSMILPTPDSNLGAVTDETRT